MTDHTRELPHDIQAEQSVLGGMILSNDALTNAQELLHPQDFYRPAHQIIYTALSDLHARGEPVDAITLNTELVKRGESERTGRAPYLHTLIDTVPAAANTGYYAKIVADLATLRHLVQAGTRITQLGYTGQGEADDLVEEANSTLAALGPTRTGHDYRFLTDLIPDALDELEALAHRTNAITGIPTGFADLDALTNGLHPGQLVIVAARPAMGKSTLALDMCRSASLHHGLASIFFSLEMGRNEIIHRLLSAEARVPLHTMRSGLMTDQDWTRLAQRMGHITHAPLAIDDSPDLSMGQIAAKCRRLKQQHDLKLVVVDYLQLMATPSGAENRQQAISAMSRSLKLLAKELQVPVVVLSQLNRGPEQRTDKRPQASDLRESGAVEQDADMVVLLYREDAYDKESPRAGEADIIVAKHRNGPTADVTVAFQGHYSRFVDMAPSYH